MELSKNEELLALSAALYLLGIEVEASRGRLEDLLAGGSALSSPEVVAENNAFNRLSLEFSRLEERFLQLKGEI